MTERDKGIPKELYEEMETAEELERELRYQQKMNKGRKERELASKKKKKLPHEDK